MYEPCVNTWTIMSTSTDQGTTAITSRVKESASAALDHVNAMDRCAPVQPVYAVASRGWRWTWEYVTSDGVRCTDTVRIF